MSLPKKPRYGEYFTEIVGDAWAHIHTQAGLAQRTGSAALLYRVVEGALTSLSTMILRLSQDLAERGRTDHSAEYVIALTNNCKVNFSRCTQSRKGSIQGNHTKTRY